MFVNPANVTEYRTTKVHDEIIKLYDQTGAVNMFPDYVSRPEVKFQKNSAVLNDKELEKYKKEIGTRTYEEYGKLIETEAYKAMSPEERVKALSEAKSDIKGQVDFKTIKASGDDFDKLMRKDRSVYFGKTQLELDNKYLNRWAKLDPSDDKTVRDAQFTSSVVSAVSAFEKEGLLNEDNIEQINKYVQNKTKREPTMLDLGLLGLYRATGSAAVFHGSYQSLLEFTDGKIPYKINYPAGSLHELLAQSDSAVLKEYGKLMSSSAWLNMTNKQKEEALSKAKSSARAAFENGLKKQYGARIDIDSRAWAVMTPEERNKATKHQYKIK